jgi:hypothetical protein
MRTVLIGMAGIIITIFGMCSQIHVITVIGLLYIGAATYWIAKNTIK